MGIPTMASIRENGTSWEIHSIETFEFRFHVSVATMPLNRLPTRLSCEFMHDFPLIMGSPSWPSPLHLVKNKPSAVTWGQSRYIAPQWTLPPQSLDRNGSKWPENNSTTPSSPWCCKPEQRKVVTGCPLPSPVELSGFLQSVIILQNLMMILECLEFQKT